MSKILLAKPKLCSESIDLAVGEAHIVRDSLFNALSLDTNVFCIDLSANHNCEYQDPTGYAPLVKYLEDKHQAPVVITNGAKQGLGSIFYALNKMGKKQLGLRNIYWALIPPLVEAHNLQVSYDQNYDAFLAVLPSNPDGHMISAEQATYLANWHRDQNIPFIIDEVYNSPVYVSNYEGYGKLGDVQLYSMSKGLGLSGLRVGYAVCHNKKLYHLIQEYVEMMTVGVSTASQSIVLDLLQELDDTNKYNMFVKCCQNHLYENKTIIKLINKNILNVPDDMENIAGMFAFVKCNNREAFNKTKIHIADGIHFGKDGFIRMNLAVRKEVLIEVVQRLNNV